MPTIFHIGEGRIGYKSKGFVTGKVVTAYIWSPSLIKSSLQTFTELEGGLYYLDFNFNATGKYMAIFYENGISVTFSTFRVIEELELIYGNVSKLLKIETGRWKIENNQLFIYDSDETTILYKFDLKDKFGHPSDKDVFEREPV